MLSIGHSARDTFYMLRDCGFEMIKKPFAVGVRIEHPQSLINRALYGDFADHPALSAADYSSRFIFKAAEEFTPFVCAPAASL